MARALSWPKLGGLSRYSEIVLIDAVETTGVDFLIFFLVFTLDACLLVLQNVGWLITEMQKKIFESQGVSGKFGVSFLGRISQLYANDAEMMAMLMKFVDR